MDVFTFFPLFLFENPSYGGYSQSDVRVFWWNDYRFYAKRGTKYDSEGKWDKHFMNLLDNDIVGPRMPMTWHCSSFVAMSNVTDNSLFSFKPATERLRNYTSAQAKRAIRIFTENVQHRPDGSAASITGPVGYSQLCNVEMDSDSDTDCCPFSSDTDGPMFEILAPSKDRSAGVGIRSKLKPIYDQICDLNMSCIDVMNEKIHKINQFFHDLDINRNKKQDDGAKYVSVCTQKETSRGRCYVSSNGLK